MPFIKTIRFFWGMSFLLFIAAMLYINIELPEDTAVWFDASGKGLVFVNKNAFFYGGLGLAVFANLLVINLGNILMKLPKKVMPVPRKEEWFETMESEADLRECIKQSFRGLALVVNMALFSMTLLMFNLNVGNTSNGLLLFVPSMIALGWVVFVILLSNRKILIDIDK